MDEINPANLIDPATQEEEEGGVEVVEDEGGAAEAIVDDGDDPAVDGNGEDADLCARDGSGVDCDFDSPPATTPLETVDLDIGLPYGYGGNIALKLKAKYEGANEPSTALSSRVTTFEWDSFNR